MEITKSTINIDPRGGNEVRNAPNLLPRNIDTMKHFLGPSNPQIAKACKGNALPQMLPLPNGNIQLQPL